MSGEIPSGTGDTNDPTASPELSEAERLAADQQALEHYFAHFDETAWKEAWGGEITGPDAPPIEGI